LIPSDEIMKKMFKGLNKLKVNVAESDKTIAGY
jgi:hypothetical protein